MTKTKQITKIVAVIMIAFCILSVPKAVHAARVDNICYQWDEISQTSNYGVLHYNTNEKYKTIKVKNSPSIIMSPGQLLSPIRLNQQEQDELLNYEEEEEEEIPKKKKNTKKEVIV